MEVDIEVEVWIDVRVDPGIVTFRSSLFDVDDDDLEDETCLPLTVIPPEKILRPLRTDIVDSVSLACR